jgi:hypothetical protein
VCEGAGVDVADGVNDGKTLGLNGSQVSRRYAMKTVGIRCSNSDYSYAILSGKKSSPKLLQVETHLFPKGYSQPQCLKWLLQELEELSKRHLAEKWIIKGAEPMATRDKAFVSRVEFEAMALLAAGNGGVVSVERKVKQTIAKELGLAGKAKALKSDLDHSLIAGLSEMSEKQFEAVVAAWSALPQ